jgi:serine/threonine protein phosphatase PrpC
MAQGPKRTQEDRLINQRLTLDGVLNGYGRLMAVMDGHGGDKVSELLCRNLPRLFSECLIKYKGDVQYAIAEAIEILHDMTDKESPGSTLAMAYIPEGELDVYVAALGDSLILVARSDGSDMLGPIHSAEHHKEDREEAVRRGGTYAKGYIRIPHGERTMGLQPTRAFGDCEFKEVLIREPFIQHISLDERTYVLLASDGLLDSAVDLPTQVQQIMYHMRNGSTAADFVAHTEDGMKTKDNVAVVTYMPDEERESIRCGDGEMIGELNNMLDAWERVRFFHKVTDYFSGVNLKNMHAHVSVNDRGHGILLLGEKGAGKSKLSIDMLDRRENFRFVCDDKLIVSLIDHRLFAACHPAFREKGILFRPQGTPAEEEDRTFHHISDNQIQKGFVRIRHVVEISLNRADGARGEVTVLPTTEIFRLFRERLTVSGDELHARPALNQLSVLSLSLPADENVRFRESDELLARLLDLMERGRGYAHHEMAQAPNTDEDWKEFH